MRRVARSWRKPTLHPRRIRWSTEFAWSGAVIIRRCPAQEAGSHVRMKGKSFGLLPPAPPPGDATPPGRACWSRRVVARRRTRLVVSRPVRARRHAPADPRPHRRSEPRRDGGPGVPEGLGCIRARGRSRFEFGKGQAVHGGRDCALGSGGESRGLQGGVTPRSVTCGGRALARASRNGRDGATRQRPRA